MNKLDYLKLAVRLSLFRKRAWVISAFAITKDKDDGNYIGKLISHPWGYAYIDDRNEQIRIEDSKPNEPLFKFNERLMVDATVAANMKEPTETSIGNLLFNHICILSTFGPKHPFPLGKVSVSKLEDGIAEKLKDTPLKEEDRSSSFYYVDEYVKFVNSLQYLTTFTQIATWSATRKGIIAPTGIKEFKATLIEKYKGKLTDPVMLAKFEAELLAFDDKFLQDDPANGTFLSGKIKHTARKKMFLSMGADPSFHASSTVVPMTNSLTEKWSTDPTEFTAAMNGLRVGSFSRGAETVKGGVSAKLLLRAANNFKIVDTDCGSTLGIKRHYTHDDAGKLAGRYQIKGKQSVLIENKESVPNDLNSEITLRTPMYCKLEGDNICKVCAGVKLSQFPTGITIPLTEISAIILTASLKMMHQSSLTTVKMNLAEVIS